MTDEQPVTLENLTDKQTLAALKDQEAEERLCSRADFWIQVGGINIKGMALD